MGEHVVHGISLIMCCRHAAWCRLHDCSARRLMSDRPHLGRVALHLSTAASVDRDLSTCRSQWRSLRHLHPSIAINSRVRHSPLAY